MAKARTFKYESRKEDVKITMLELERAALKEVAKLLRKEVKKRVPVKTGTLKKNIGTWVKRKGKDGPHLQIGVYTAARAKRKGYKFAFHAHMLEFGTKKMRARPFLAPAVLENVDEIRKIQGKYLKEIEDENRAKGLIDEKEEISDE